MSGFVNLFTSNEAIEQPAAPPPTITILPFTSEDAIALVAALASEGFKRNDAVPTPASLSASRLDIPLLFNS